MALARQLDIAAAPGDTLAGLLSRASVEVSALAQVFDGLQSVLGPSTIDLRALGQEAVERVQSLDYLSQHLHALGQFIEALSRVPAARSAADPATALALVPLAGLARRLAGRPAGAGAGDDDDFEMF